MNCICCKNWGKCPVFDCEEDDRPFEWKDGIGFSCDLNGDGFIPDFITPAQYKERTGRDYPDNAPVFVLVEDSYYGDKWVVVGFEVAKNATTSKKLVLCAFGDLVPPDDWRPE